MNSFSQNGRPDARCPLCDRPMLATGSDRSSQGERLTLYKCSHCVTDFLGHRAPASFGMNKEGKIVESNVLGYGDHP